MSVNKHAFYMNRTLWFSWIQDVLRRAKCASSAKMTTKMTTFETLKCSSSRRVIASLVLVVLFLVGGPPGISLFSERARQLQTTKVFGSAWAQ